MPAMSAEAVVGQLGWRYATKKFDANRKIPEATWAALEQALVLSPSSFGLQPWRFVVVKDPAVRARLREASWNQTQITDASHMVVFARKTRTTPEDVERYVQRILEVRKAPAAALEDYKKMMLGFVTNPNLNLDSWASKQAYIALGVFLSAAAMLGVDACPMEGIDPAVYDQVLGLPAQGYSALVVATAGYRASDDWLASLPKVRFPQADVVKHV